MELCIYWNCLCSGTVYVVKLCIYCNHICSGTVSGGTVKMALCMLGIGDVLIMSSYVLQTFKGLLNSNAILCSECVEYTNCDIKSFRLQL